MKKSIAMKWVKALRSGKFKQAKGELRIDGPRGGKSHCCLGVLCEITNSNYNAFAGGVPEAVKRKTGLQSTMGSIDDDLRGELDTDCYSLAEINDQGASFKKIAKIIEKNWKRL